MAGYSRCLGAAHRQKTSTPASMADCDLGLIGCPSMVATACIPGCCCLFALLPCAQKPSSLQQLVHLRLLSLLDHPAFFLFDCRYSLTYGLSRLPLQTNSNSRSRSSCRQSFFMPTVVLHADSRSSCRQSFFMPTVVLHADSRSSCRQSFFMPILH